MMQRIALSKGEELSSDVFYMPTFGVSPEELDPKSDEIWTVKYADLLS